MSKRSAKLRYTKGYKYRLSETFWAFTNLRPYEEIRLGHITLTREGLLIGGSGYSSDGPSGPTIDTKSFMPGAFGHDMGYELLRNNMMNISCDIVRDLDNPIPDASHEQIRAEFDLMLKEMTLEDGMWKFRSNYVYYTVRQHGRGSADKPRKVYVAP